MKKINYQGWANCLQLSNGVAELVITLDVGPRILRFGPAGGVNVFKEYPEQAGKSGESEWMIRGGHRLWIAPEGDHCYLPDNSTISHVEKSENHALIQSQPDETCGWLKEIEVVLDPVKKPTDKNHVKVTHRLKALRDLEQPWSLWALSVMAPGGTAILPQPPLATHPEQLLPNRKLVLWPYTEISDSRYQWSGPSITVKQQPDSTPTKIGLLHQTGWAGYQLGSWLFAKSVAWQPGANYPDEGVNFELFTNHEMLELETLAPLVSLKKGEVVEHVEEWYLVEHRGFIPSKHSLLPIVGA